jgi:hypothetical protein
MRANTDPRRVYTRSGEYLICFKGEYFGANAEKSNINPEKEVKLEELPKHRIQVQQGKTKETWSPKTVTVKHRAA